LQLGELFGNFLEKILQIQEEMKKNIFSKNLRSYIWGKKKILIEKKFFKNLITPSLNP